MQQLERMEARLKAIEERPPPEPPAAELTSAAAPLMQQLERMEARLKAIEERSPPEPPACACVVRGNRPGADLVDPPALPAAPRRALPQPRRPLPQPRRPLPAMLP